LDLVDHCCDILPSPAHPHHSPDNQEEEHKYILAMYLTALLPLLSLLPSTLAIPIQQEKRDASFFDVRTKMFKDMSGRKGDPADKYFRKSTRVLFFHWRSNVIHTP
jgi:hypothetical protein